MSLGGIRELNPINEGVLYIRDSATRPRGSGCMGFSAPLVGLIPTLLYSSYSTHELIITEEKFQRNSTTRSSFYYSLIILLFAHHFTIRSSFYYSLIIYRLYKIASSFSVLLHFIDFWLIFNKY